MKSSKQQPTVSLSILHDTIYKACNEVLRDLNPCQIQKGPDGVVSCYHSRLPGNHHNHGVLCCVECKHHSIEKGCTTQSLSCKVWLCYDVRRQTIQGHAAFVALSALRGTAATAGINLSQVRSTKEQELTK